MQLLSGTEPVREMLEALVRLAEILVTAAQEWVKTLAHAAHVDKPTEVEGHTGASSQDDMDDFLTAVDRVGSLEHEADDAERALTSVAIQHAHDFRQLHLYAEMGRSLEAGADALKRASLLAREHILEGVLGGY
jgi:hypothetical protein